MASLDVEEFPLASRRRRRPAGVHLRDSRSLLGIPYSLLLLFLTPLLADYFVMNIFLFNAPRCIRGTPRSKRV